MQGSAIQLTRRMYRGGDIYGVSAAPMNLRRFFWAPPMPRLLKHELHTHFGLFCFRRKYAEDSKNASGIEFLSQRANEHPQNSSFQQEYYESLLASDPGLLIRRFRDKSYARNKESALLFLQALQKTGEIDTLASQIASGSAQEEPLGSKNKPLFVQPLPTNKTWARVTFVFNALFLGALAYSLYLFTAQRFSGLAMPAHRVYDPEKEEPASFDDVRGCDEAKHELEEIVEFLRSPERFVRFGARLPKGILLVGPPGTGKTLLARAVAGEAGVPFFYASGSEMDEMFVGVGSQRVKQLFEKAKQQAPAIIFIDEIDAMGSRRNARDPQHSRMTLNQLLTEMDGFSTNENVVVIAATNFPESLDPALLRPGRFDKHVHVTLPDVKGRREILDLHLKGSMSHNIDLSLLARATPGFSGADLAKLVNQAKILASKEGAAVMSMKHLEWSRDEMIMGIEKKSALISPADRNITAFHEGGHALIALLTPGAMPIHKATIIPRSNALGMVAQLPDGDQLSMTRSQLLARIDVAMGGRAAEELIFGDSQVTTGAASDFFQATEVARAMVTRYGMSEVVGLVSANEEQIDKFGPETKALIEREVKRILTESYSRAKGLLKTHRESLEGIANALLEKETLDKDELRRIAAV